MYFRGQRRKNSKYSSRTGVLTRAWPKTWGVPRQQRVQLGQVLPGAVDVEQLPVGEGLEHVLQLFHVDAAGPVGAVEAHQLVNLLGGQRGEVLLPAQVDGLGAVVEGVEHAVRGEGGVALEDVPAHVQSDAVGLDGVLNHIAAPGAPVHGDEHLLFLQLPVEVPVDFPLFLSPEHTPSPFLESFPVSTGLL